MSVVVCHVVHVGLSFDLTFYVSCVMFKYCFSFPVVHVFVFSICILHVAMACVCFKCVKRFLFCLDWMSRVHMFFVSQGLSNSIFHLCVRIFVISISFRVYTCAIEFVSIEFIVAILVKATVQSQSREVIHQHG